ncbi:TrkA-N domain protein [Stackebrandtia nassauensis DSM 44728]|uniref:TrkA-N domain protein n=2 Tax=Stackebrandtia TaxID=283810 RepID=D3PTY6_STANL|nr:TrkA-N domain protein [Stackebrandtia nassauensis DSM 44728]
MAFRLVEELVFRHRENVTVILPSRRRNHGPQISRVPTVRVVENDQLDADAFSSARITQAKALALMAQDDVGNIHAALRALEITEIRVVVRCFNTNLGNRIEPLLGDCTLLSDASMASPSFVAAALGEVAPRYSQVLGRTLYVTASASDRGDRLTWPIAGGPDEGVLLPGEEVEPSLFVTVATRRPRRALVTASKHRVRSLATRLWDELREILDRKLRFITLFLVAVIVLGSFLIWNSHKGDGQSFGWLESAYVVILAAAGGIDPVTGAEFAEKFAHVLVAISGVLLVPIFTASIVENMVGRRLAAEAGRLRGPISDHVIVVGLGNVGTRIAVQLRNLGVPVVAIERNARCHGVDVARSQDIPVVYGDASQLETLHAAQVRTCRSLVAVTSNDIVNLEAALHARSIRQDLRTVLRLFEQDLAERVQKHFDISASLSVAGVAAAEFAAAMTDRNVKGTIPVGRHLVLIGEFTVEDGSELAGQPLSQIDADESLRVLAISKVDETDWAPDPQRLMDPGDTVLVLATRRGLAATVRRAAPSTGPEEPRLGQPSPFRP